MSIGNNVVIQGIYNDIEESLNTILDAHAAELGGLLRLQQEQIQMVADRKKLVLSQMRDKIHLNETQQILNTLNANFIKEELELKKELSELKQVIMDSIIEQECNEQNQVMSESMVKYLKRIRKSVKQKKNEAMIVLNNQADKEYKLFSTIISGFSKRFYIRLDRLTDFWQKKISVVNEFLEAEGMIDKEYGIDELVFEPTDSIKHSETIKSNATTATNVTGKLLDKALRPGFGCIAMAGIKQLRIGLKHISDRITGHRLYKSIFSGNDVHSDITVSTNEMKMRRKMYNDAIPLGHIHDGYESNSSIDTDYVKSLPGSQQGPEVNVLDNTPPSGITRSSSLPLEAPVPIMFSPRFNEELLSQKTDDPRFFRRPIVPGKITATKGRTARYHNPLGKPRSKKGSPKGITRRNSMGGKKHRRRTTHRKKRIN
jgi:hypothetical protein